jgi:serine/threonine-protein kinase
MPLGRYSEARAQLRQAQELDPLSLVIGATLGLLAYVERRYDEAVEYYRDVLELDERFTLAQYFLGQALTEQSKYPEAIARLHQALATGGRSAEVVAALAGAQALAGHTDVAESLLSELQAMAGTKYVSPVLIGQVHLALGRRAEALEALAQGFRAKSAEMIWLGVRPTFDALRDDPRFVALLQQLGLQRPPTPTVAERTP